MKRHVWRHLHAANQKAHRHGRQARATGLPPTANPYQGDQWYWWREGYAGRPFEPLSLDDADVQRIAAALRTAS